MGNSYRVHVASALAASVLISPLAEAKGPTVAYFAGPPTATSDSIANMCITRGDMVVEQDDRHVLCQREMSGMSGVFAHLLIGNSYSTPPQVFMRYAINKWQDQVIVQATAWMETQMAFGQTRRQPMDGKKPSSQLLSLMQWAGGSPVPMRIEAPTEPAPPASQAAPAAVTEPTPSPPPEAKAQPKKPTPRPAVRCTTCR